MRINGYSQIRHYIPAPDIRATAYTLVCFHPCRHLNILHTMVTPEPRRDAENPSSLQKEVKNSGSIVVGGCAKAGDETRIAINESVNNDAPSNKTCR